MKYLKRFFILQFLLLFILPITLADISITLPERSVYNLGDKISPIVSIKQTQDYDGFFNMNIVCKNYDFQYFKKSLSLEADFRTQLTDLDLSLSKSMLGDCRLKSNFEISDGQTIDTADSSSFLVTDEITITIDEKLEANPGEKVDILGEVRKADNQILKTGEVTISFNDNEYLTNITLGRFENTIILDEDAQTGFFPMLVVVRDKYNNYGDKILILKVNSIPTRISNNFDNDILMPGDILKVQVNLYDQKSEVMDSNISVKVYDPNDKLIAEKLVESSHDFELNIEINQIPGNYLLVSIFDDINQQDSFVIGILRKIIMDQVGNFVHIENVGNVEYDEEISIILESDEKTYLINKKIDLEPGEKITIDLSNEVPQGTYDIIFPEESVEDGIVMQDVQIDDNRNIIKKTFSGISSITGAVVGAAGYIASKPLLATIILVLIIFGTVTHYSWGFIKNKVKGRKEGDSNHLFEDFKYNDNEK